MNPTTEETIAQVPTGTKTRTAGGQPDTPPTASSHSASTSVHAAMDAACQQACQAIAPAWPLDRSIAVNPHWQRIGLPLRTVAARMALLGGAQVYPTRSHFQQAWNSGRISQQDLQAALAQLAPAQRAGLDGQGCVAALNQPQPSRPLPLLMDLLDTDPGRSRHLPWRQAVTHQISQTCAAYFDHQQADWQPRRPSGQLGQPGQGLYAFWRETLQHDHGIGVLMGLPRLGQQLASLPATPALAEQWVLTRLGLPPKVWADYLEALLLTINGWASWCAYLQWQAAQQGTGDAHLRELLAIRLAWGAILLDGGHLPHAEQAFVALQQAWSGAAAAMVQAEQGFAVEEVWQLALEAGYQRQLAGQLGSAGSLPAMTAVAAQEKTIEVQAAFCIDVRSEPLRRALESAQPSVQTLGFAGFFGLPIAYTPLGTNARRPQLPGLLAPAMEVADTFIASAGGSAALSGLPDGLPDGLQAAQKARAQQFSLTEQWQSAGRWPAAAFSFVEAFGWAYSGKLTSLLRAQPKARQRDDLAGLPARLRPVCRPALVGLDVAARTNLAARVLHAMGLDHHVAPVVVLAGHGSQSANNPHAAGLDCGACCGQTGEVNARVLAQILNDTGVRAGLLDKGILIPEATVFVAVLHNTTTDEMEWFDLDLLPAHAAAPIAQLQASFVHALHQVRRERASSLGLSPDQSAKSLLANLQSRASDAAQTRPEWGLAGNAAFVIAPRARTRGSNLGGRSFLHDYDEAHDSDGSVLELLMTAPMLVTHWINWQYHASTCEPVYFGSGNKVLHNVVGGNIGVFEGNGGDLRIGLSKQSLHNGQKWVHEPLRLTVAIEAPRQRIEATIAKHAAVRQLIDNGWLHLWHVQGEQLARYAAGQWLPLATELA